MEILLEKYKNGEMHDKFWLGENLWETQKTFLEKQIYKGQSIFVNACGLNKTSNLLFLFKFTFYFSGGN